MKKIFVIPAYLGLALMLLGTVLIAFVTVDNWLNSSGDAGFEWVTPLLYLVGGIAAFAGAVLAGISGLIGKPRYFHVFLIFMGIIYLVCYCAIVYYLLNRTVQSGSINTEIDNLAVWALLFLLPAVTSISGGLMMRKSNTKHIIRSGK